MPRCRRHAIGLEVDLEASPQTLLLHIAARWDIEVLFGDSKEELGLDQYQLMSAIAIVRFWTLAMLAYVFLEEERDRRPPQWQRPVTIGEARRAHPASPSTTSARLAS